MKTVIGHPPLPGHGLGRLHVDRIDVGSLLAVDLDADEPSVHLGRDVGVLERFVRHHVAPVAGRVADRQQDRHVALAGRGERLVTPRVPVDRVVGVLAQIRAGFLGQAVPTGHAATVPAEASTVSR